MLRYLSAILLFSGLFLSGFFTQAQDSAKIKWNTSAQKLTEGKYEIQLTAHISRGWHLYADHPELEITGLMTSLDATTVKLGELHPQSNAKSINDLVFETKVPAFTDTVSFKQIMEIDGEVPSTIRLQLNYFVGEAENFIPEEPSLDIILEAGASTQKENRILIPSIDLANPATDCGKDITGSVQDTRSEGYFSLFLLGFLGGLIALLTPCVFPMIPLTVSFFTKKSQSRSKGIQNAVLYGFFILLIYVLLSIPFHFLDSINPEILNNISTNAYLNVFFFIVFILFAFSFFGFYEINLPGSMANRVDSKSGVGNIAGIFFMALTLALVSFSCTGPILGSLLAGSLSSDGGAMQLTSGMAGFGLALALPFALFALFPNWLSALPKSGGWLNTVKVVLGFLELGLALKFLSNADLVMHWGILKREIFIGIWIIIGILLTLYLWGKLRFKHDTPLKKLSYTRRILGLVAGLFTLYLLPGVTHTKYSNLTLISGFPPPLYYSIYASESDFVLGLNGVRDYEEGLALARASNKPMLIDFTGFACVNCRRMEEGVWSKPDVYALMKENFIIVSLYVDDKKKLPLSERFTYKTREGIEKEIVTVGDKWSTFETENFQKNAQPWYAILNIKEELLSHPVGYVPNAQEYKAWLQCGLDAFNQKK